MHFCECLKWTFVLRYGETHPVFYVGSLENAIKEALNGKAKDVSLPMSHFWYFPSSLKMKINIASQDICYTIYITVYIFFFPQRKLLAVYLHHDGSILSNVFCSQILCSESVVNYLSSNFITWAWDMTHETNCARY